MAPLRIKKSTLKYIKYGIVGLAVLVLLVVLLRFVSCGDGDERAHRRERIERRHAEEHEPYVPKVIYGIEYENYEVETAQIKNNQTLSHILGMAGVGSAMIDRIDREARPVFNLRNIRAGNNYTLFYSRDTTGRRRLEHFVYEKDRTEYIVVSLEGDVPEIRKYEREVTTTRRKETASVSSSLWNSMVANGIPPSLAVELENIYGWSVDFFHLQADDKFTVIFDERHIDTVRLGVGRVWGAEFVHRGKTYYAIPFRQDGRVEYWDEQGNSMKKQFLKAPLKYSRISSGFSRSRLHPIHRVYRPHLGIDYAAPRGTPVYAIGDGTVTVRGWDSKGGGNYIKIRHSNNYVSTYMHLHNFASGIAVGTRVSQGQVIGYVGSTGDSTGPHLDFRMQKNGEYVNPLHIPSGTGEPVKAQNREEFKAIAERVMQELRGEVADSLKITSL